jgi:hypothetical protein
MPETKPDKRFQRNFGILMAGFGVAVFVAVPICCAASTRESTDLWFVVIVLIAAVALGGIAYSVWIFQYYRCPQCRASLRPEPGERNKPLRIRYHCKQCDTIWDSGITWGAD